jgi:addiction module HigA family antidote
MPIIRSNQLPTQHPGVVFKCYYLDRYNTKLSDAAKTLDIETFHLNNFIKGEITVTPPLAIRLEKVTGISSGFWLNLQKIHDLHKI